VVVIVAGDAGVKDVTVGSFARAGFAVVMGTFDTESLETGRQPGDSSAVRIGEAGDALAIETPRRIGSGTIFDNRATHIFIIVAVEIFIVIEVSIDVGIAIAIAIAIAIGVGVGVRVRVSITASATETGVGFAPSSATRGLGTGDTDVAVFYCEVIAP
jgi:hypothetical protein